MLVKLAVSAKFCTELKRYIAVNLTIFLMAYIVKQFIAFVDLVSNV